MKIRQDGHIYQVETALTGGRWATNIYKLSSAQLAQLLVDVAFLPQPDMHHSEARNLCILIAREGHKRLGSRFNRLLAQQLITA